jgi:hypothetical protein
LRYCPAKGGKGFGLHPIADSNQGSRRCFVKIT